MEAVEVKKCNFFNFILSTVAVTCRTDGITLRLREPQPFNGHIYVKGCQKNAFCQKTLFVAGQSGHEHCSATYSIEEHPSNEYEFTTTFNQCDIRRPSPVSVHKKSKGA